LLYEKELPTFKFELEKSKGKILGSEQSRILIAFNTGVYESIDLSSWIAGNPVDVLKTNFNKPESLIRKFPRKDVFIAPSE
jgi:oxalate decarboxylase